MLVVLWILVTLLASACCCLAGSLAEAWRVSRGLGDRLTRTAAPPPVREQAAPSAPADEDRPVPPKKERWLL